MSSLRNKLKKLSFYTHHPRNHETVTIDNVTEEYPSKEEVWDDWFNMDYGGGVLSENLTIVNQRILNSTGGSDKIGVKTSRSYSSSTKKYTFKVTISAFLPATIPSSSSVQPSTLHYVSGEGVYDKTSSSRTSSVVVLTITSSSSSYSSRVTSGSVTYTLPAYYDSKNNIYYTGVQYTCSFTDVTNTVQYYDVTYI